LKLFQNNFISHVAMALRNDANGKAEHWSHCGRVQVHGIIRRASTFNTHRIEHLYENPMSHAEGGLYDDIQHIAKQS